ncbi:AmmeMemoRadiSam system radical SAM enzyme [Desulfobaculum bizertense]|uniref:AmmeMemoRadiSam system radical SAM enzyme n=1 Tax=Desulfobaculum bizertense TaxID=376490 RepID=UPI001F36E609|nr:AmmeMemoRadiSam system radical SAM enzyme [Desulfobaculum bizertense]UIJ36731.1 AmmeMemoRadiSam system radical SAM enzyme [Desulfobaculum bizertense]
MRQASLWTTSDNQTVLCQLCSHFCHIDPGGRGRCGVRINRDGTLFTLADTVAAIHSDPVEKKPLFHFLPGTKTMSFAAMGCNFACSWCQNAPLSQLPRQGSSPQGQCIRPEKIVQMALSEGCDSISYTYSEPTIFFELMEDTAKLAHEAGLKNIMVSNGFQSPQCLHRLGPLMDAANIDLKAFAEDTYEQHCEARLKPVLQNLKRIKAFGWWLEVTTLVIPDLNDSPEELGDIAHFIAESLGVETPWHVSRFHPDYQMSDRGPTPTSRIEQAVDIGKNAGLQFVYAGNIAGHMSESTFCPNCGEMLIERRGYTLGKHIPGAVCPGCGAAVAGVFA